MRHLFDVEKKGEAEQTAPLTEASAQGSDNEAMTQASDPAAQNLPVFAVGKVAVVNGESIPAAKFNDAIKLTMGMMQGQPLPFQSAQMLKSSTLDRLIDMTLIDAALAASDITISEDEVDAELAKFKERLPSPEAYKEFLALRGLTDAKLRENITKDRQLRALLAQKYGPVVSEEQVRAYYDENKDSYTNEAQVHARHILLNVKSDADTETVAETKKRAQAIAKQAQKPGADFEALAKEKSEGLTASQGGDLGFFEKTRMVPAFADAAFAMDAGEISDPVRSNYGFHIIQVVATKEAGVTHFEDVKDDIAAQLKRQNLREMMASFLKELKSGAEIVRHEENITVNVEAPEAGAQTEQERLQEQIQLQLERQQQQAKEEQEGSKQEVDKDAKRKKLQQQLRQQR